MRFSIFQESRQGKRQYNQDRVGYIYSRDALMIVVADGMGGHSNGEVAAQITVDTLGRKFQAEARPRLPDPLRFLHEGILSAHNAILSHTDKAALLETPRTTIVAAVIQNGSAVWAHVGDSRLYILRNGQAVAQTKDHSRIQQLVDQGLVREEAAAVHPERNKIFNCLGAHIPPQIELSGKFAMEPRDTMLLCSDGVWGPVPSRLLATSFLTEGLPAAVRKLMDEAEQRAGADADNLSAVAMNWDDTAVVSDAVSTLTLPPGTFNSQMDLPEADAPTDSWSDDEIDKAIAEIKTALAKTGRRGP